MDFKNLVNSAANIAASSGKTDLPLSSNAMSTLNELIGKGVFSDKADFIQFIIKAYMEYKMGGGSSQPTQANVSDIIQNSGIGGSLNEADIQNKLIPLVTEALEAAGKNKIV